MNSYEDIMNTIYLKGLMKFENHKLTKVYVSEHYKDKQEQYKEFEGIEIELKKFKEDKPQISLHFTLIE